MSKKQKIISSNNMPSMYPAYKLAVVFLLLERFNAPEWSFGFFWCFCIGVFLLVLYRWSKTETVDIFKETVNPKLEVNFENKEDFETFLEKLKKHLGK